MLTRIEKGENWELRLGKWQDSPPSEVDHIISDPPYDERTHAGGRRSTTGRTTETGIVERLEIPFDPLSDEELLEFATWGPAIARRWVLAFCAIEQLGTYKAANEPLYIRGGVFVKTNATPQFSGDRPATFGDGLAIFHRPGRKVWNGGGKAGIWRAARGYQRRADKHHPTEKPLSLMRELVADFTSEGDLIWDCYAGSATTGVAALTMGRRFIGHEINPVHFETSVARLRAIENGTTLRGEKRARRRSVEVGQTVLFSGGSDDDA